MPGAPETYPLSLHDALPISAPRRLQGRPARVRPRRHRPQQRQGHRGGAAPLPPRVPRARPLPPPHRPAPPRTPTRRPRAGRCGVARATRQNEAEGGAMTHQALLAAALQLEAAGYSVVPARPDGSKAPIGTWRQYMDTRPSRADLTAWLADGDYDGIGIVCGAISGNLEMLELEGRA